jgi:hypothetical protein
MKTYEFTVIASGLDPKSEDFEARFFEAGCDDATVSFQKGHILVDFAREADSLEAAIASAIDCVKRAGAQVERVEPDPIVSLSEIAVRANCSRAAVSHYWTGARGKGFPAPFARVTSDSPLWNWSDVAKWFVLRGKLTEDIAIDASIFTFANDLLQSGRCPTEQQLKENSTRYAEALRRGELVLG